MKRFCLILALLLAAAASSASAEIVGLGSDDEYIHRFIAPNGQELYFTSTLEEPFIERKDVNFDGREDLAVVTVLGASNAWYEFFLLDGDTYVRCQHDAPLINYSLDDRGYVLSQGSNGMAGALFETHLLRWQGTELKTVRTMISEEKTETVWQENQFTTTTWMDACLIRLWDNTASQGSPSLLWEFSLSLDEFTADTFDEIDAQLWKGLE